MEELLQVGVITSTHGVRGEVKVISDYKMTRSVFKTLKHVLFRHREREKTSGDPGGQISLNSL